MSYRPAVICCGLLLLGGGACTHAGEAARAVAPLQSQLGQLQRSQSDLQLQIETLESRLFLLERRLEQVEPPPAEGGERTGK